MTTKRNIIIAVAMFFLLMFTSSISAQQKKSIFIGLQPGVTAEPYYEKNELDINVVPVTIQIPVSRRFDLRATTIGNYHFGGEQNGFSDLGIQFVSPFYFKKKEEINSNSKGFYVGPVLGLGRNLIYDNYTTTIALEPGYQIPIKNSFSLSLGLQLGGSYFTYDNQPNVWRSHFGIKVNIGFWVNQ